MIEYFDYTLGDSKRFWIWVSSLVWGVVVMVYAGWWDWRVRRVPNALWILTAFPIPVFIGVRDWRYELLGLPMVIVYAVMMRYRTRWGSGDSKAVVWAALTMGPLPAILGMLLTSIWVHVKKIPLAPVLTYYAVFLGGVNSALSITLFIMVGNP